MGGAILNVILNYWFIAQYDLMGAVYGTLTTYMITFIGMQCLLHHYFGIRTYRVFYYTIDFYERIVHLIKDKINPRWVIE
jgi:O-antigen/teichoic acid export membrane protein